MSQYAYDRGVRLFETADMYGTHEFAGKVMKKAGRENVTTLTKIMVYRHKSWYKPGPFQKSTDRFRKVHNTGYIDILLLHCLAIVMESIEQVDDIIEGIMKLAKL